MPAVLLAGEEGFWHCSGCKAMPAAAGEAGGGGATPTGPEELSLNLFSIRDMSSFLTFVLLGTPFTRSDKQGADDVQQRLTDKTLIRDLAKTGGGRGDVSIYVNTYIDRYTHTAKVTCTCIGMRKTSINILLT